MPLRESTRRRARKTERNRLGPLALQRQLLEVGDGTLRLLVEKIREAEVVEAQVFELDPVVLRRNAVAKRLFFWKVSVADKTQQQRERRGEREKREREGKKETLMAAGRSRFVRSNRPWNHLGDGRVSKLMAAKSVRQHTRAWRTPETASAPC